MNIALVVVEKRFCLNLVTHLKESNRLFKMLIGLIHKFLSREQTFCVIKVRHQFTVIVLRIETKKTRNTFYSPSQELQVKLSIKILEWCRVKHNVIWGRVVVTTYCFNLKILDKNTILELKLAKNELKALDWLHQILQIKLQTKTNHL